TEHVRVALPSTAHLTSHPRGANVWPGSLTENAKSFGFDHTSKGAKALIIVRGIEMAFLTADRPSNHQPTNVFTHIDQLYLKADLLHSCSLDVQSNDFWFHCPCLCK